MPATLAGPKITLAVAVAECPLGWIAVQTTGDRVQRVALGLRGPSDAVAALGVEDAEPSRFAESVVRRIVRYTAGHSAPFDDIDVDLDHLTPLARRIALACRAIPRGETRTYGELAAECGSPRAARAVGNVMAKNRTLILIPCHRVVHAGGGLGGFSAPTGVALKQQLLRIEGALPNRP